MEARRRCPGRAKTIVLARGAKEAGAASCWSHLARVTHGPMFFWDSVTELNEKRAVFIELDLTTCLDFSCCTGFIPLSLHFFQTTFGPVFWISNCAEDRFEIDPVPAMAMEAIVFGWL